MIAVTTGASSGIGKATALLLGQDGRFRVFAGLECMAEMFCKLASKPEDMARTVQRILTARRPRPAYRAGKDAWAAVFMDAFVPVRWRDWLVKRMYGFS